MESTDVRKAQPSSCSAIERTPEGRTMSTPEFSRRSFQQGGAQLRQASTGRVLGLHVRSRGLGNAVVVDPQNAYRWYLAGQHYQFAESNWHRLPTSVSKRRYTPIGSPAQQPSSPSGQRQQTSSNSHSFKECNSSLAHSPPATSCAATATGAAASVKQLAALFTQLSAKTSSSSRVSTPRSSTSAAGSILKPQYSSPRCSSPTIRHSGTGSVTPKARRSLQRSTSPQVEASPCLKCPSGRAFFEAVTAQLQAACVQPPCSSSTTQWNTDYKPSSALLHNEPYCLQAVNELSHPSGTLKAPAIMEAESSLLDMVCKPSERLVSHRPPRLHIPRCLGSGLEAPDTLTDQDQQQTAALLIAAVDASSDYSFLSLKSPDAGSCQQDSCMHDEIDLLSRSDQCTPRIAHGARLLISSEYPQHLQEELIQPLTSISCDTYASVPCSPVPACSGVTHQSYLLGPDSDASPTGKGQHGPAEDDLSNMAHHATDNEHQRWHSSILEPADAHFVLGSQGQIQQRHQSVDIVNATRTRTVRSWQTSDAAPTHTGKTTADPMSVADQCWTPFESSDLQRRVSQQVGRVHSATASGPAALQFNPIRPDASCSKPSDKHDESSHFEHHNSMHEAWHSSSSACECSPPDSQHRIRHGSFKPPLFNSYEQSESDENNAACSSAILMSPDSVTSDYFSAGSNSETPPRTRRPSAACWSPSSPVQPQRGLRAGLNGHSPMSSVAGSDSWYSCYTDWHSANEEFSVPTSPNGLTLLSHTSSWQALSPLPGAVDPGRLEAAWEGKPACVIQ